MSKKYKTPPIVEALCEFQFVDTGLDAPWDITLIGLIYDKLRNFFPRKEQIPLNIAIAATSATNDKKEYTPLLPLIRFLDRDNKNLVQIGQNLLTVNHLKPYSSWEEFLPVIESVFKSYLEVAKPEKLRHIALRYINRIEVPKTNSQLEDFFRLRPLIPKNISEDIGTFLMGVNLLYEDVEDTLRVQLGTTDSKVPDTLIFLLEITYIFSQPQAIPLGDIPRRLDIAHKYVGNTFEACLTDDLKQTFGEVKK